MPSKKKKYNSRFPPARIKKIMQTDDEIGKVAAAVPVLISKCLEMFLTSILTSAGEVTKEKRAKTMSTSHLKECIMNVSMFDFLKDTVAEVPDMQNEEEPGTSGIALNQEVKKANKKRSANMVSVAKKRVKVTGPGVAADENEASEVTDDYSNEDDQNGMIRRSHDQLPPEPSNTSDARGSFHISLDALMSNNPASRGQPVQVTEPEAEEFNVETTALRANVERLDSPNGVSSPQKPMDLTINSESYESGSARPQLAKAAFDARKPQSAELSEKAETSHAQSGLAGTTRSIPTPLNMSHLYNPAALPPAPPVASISKDLNTKIPQGGMLSFLYSGLPGDPGVSVPSDRKKLSGAPYPYNPVAEHYKRSPQSDLPYSPAVSSSALPAAPQMRLTQPGEDDDYDN